MSDNATNVHTNAQADNASPPHLVVVGGGAAGFLGAITAAETAAQAGTPLRVTILEAGKAPLSKVRISGGGRCNVTHHCFDPKALVTSYPRGSRELLGAFHRFGPADTVRWFAQRGVELKTEPDGRMFPTTDTSSTIISCLTQTAAAAGVRLRTRTRVTAIEAQEQTQAQAPTGAATQSRFILRTKPPQQSQEPAIIHATHVLLCTGSSPKGYQLAQNLGHQITPLVPSLFTFNSKDPRLQDLAGTSVGDVQLTVKVGKKKVFTGNGPLLITHWGVSGPVVLKASAWAAQELHSCDYQAQLTINWLGNQPLGASESALREHLTTMASQHPKRRLRNGLQLPLPARLATRLVAYAEIGDDVSWAGLGRRQLDRLVQVLLRSELTINGKSTFKDEFVTCGGVQRKEVDFRTMASRVCEGLYLAGEVLDVDGITGGFNFQNAWTGGWLAGQAIGHDTDPSCK